MEGNPLLAREQLLKEQVENGEVPRCSQLVVPKRFYCKQELSRGETDPLCWGVIDSFCCSRTNSRIFCEDYKS